MRTSYKYRPQEWLYPERKLITLVKLEVKFDLTSDSDNLNYPRIYVRIAWNSLFGGI